MDYFFSYLFYLSTCCSSNNFESEGSRGPKLAKEAKSALLLMTLCELCGAVELWITHIQNWHIALHSTLVNVLTVKIMSCDEQNVGHFSTRTKTHGPSKDFTASRSNRPTLHLLYTIAEPTKKSMIRWNKQEETRVWSGKKSHKPWPSRCWRQVLKETGICKTDVGLCLHSMR